MIFGWWRRFKELERENLKLREANQNLQHRLAKWEQRWTQEEFRASEVSPEELRRVERLVRSQPAATTLRSSRRDDEGEITSGINPGSLFVLGALMSSESKASDPIKTFEPGGGSFEGGGASASYTSSDTPSSSSDSSSGGGGGSD
jgi:hypothetical protein